MSTRLYKINGEYNTFEYWHDHFGYTKTPTFSIQYKTTNPWGAAFASGGYYDAEDLMDIFTFSFFVPGVVGWNGIDDLALEGYYPAAATDLTVARDSEVSNAATLTQDNETYYLVQNDIEYGWMSQAEFEARGWSTDVGDPPSYIVFDTTTGTIVHSIVDEGMVYGDVGYVLLNDSEMITVYETGVPVESFYFTANGRNETSNTDISHADIPVYFEDGTAPPADTPYDGSSVLAFMDVVGNTKQANGESLYVDDGVLRLDAPDTDEGEQWAALVEYIEPAPSLPTVEKTDGWATTGSSAEDCYKRSSVTLYDNNRNSIQYDSTKSYVVQIGNGSGTLWRIEFFCASDSSGFLVAWNRTNVKLMVLGVSLYSCSSNSAYRVIVSDSSNVKYPAFAYDLDGTTYYYVLDDTQTDWTSDLSSIGYSLVTGSEAYLTSRGSSETTNYQIGNSSAYLYSSSGADLYGNQSKKYVLIGQFLKDGTNVTNDGMDSRLTTGMNCSAVGVSSYTSSWNRLMLNGTFYSYDVFRITYLEV